MSVSINSYKDEEKPIKLLPNTETSTETSTETTFDDLVKFIIKDELSVRHLPQSVSLDFLNTKEKFLWLAGLFQTASCFTVDQIQVESTRSNATLWRPRIKWALSIKGEKNSSEESNSAILQTAARILKEMGIRPSETTEGLERKQLTIHGFDSVDLFCNEIEKTVMIYDKISWNIHILRNLSKLKKKLDLQKQMYLSLPISALFFLQAKSELLKQPKVKNDLKQKFIQQGQTMDISPLYPFRPSAYCHSLMAAMKTEWEVTYHNAIRTQIDQNYFPDWFFLAGILETRGCFFLDPWYIKNPVDPVDPVDLVDLVDYVKHLDRNTFYKTFAENPLQSFGLYIKIAYDEPGLLRLIRHYFTNEGEYPTSHTNKKNYYYYVKNPFIIMDVFDRIKLFGPLAYEYRLYRCRHKAYKLCVGAKKAADKATKSY
jgi:hypothetical protein